MSCVTMGLYYRIIPYTHHLMRTIYLEDVQQLMYTLLRKEKKIDQPVSGLLYFPMEQQKMKDLELVYGGKENRISLKFK